MVLSSGQSVTSHILRCLDASTTFSPSLLHVSCDKLRRCVVSNRLSWIKVTWLTHDIGVQRVQPHFEEHLWPPVTLEPKWHVLRIVSWWFHVMLDMTRSSLIREFCCVTSTIVLQSMPSGLWLTYHFKRNIHSILMIPCQNSHHWNSHYNFHWLF